MADELKRWTGSSPKAYDPSVHRAEAPVRHLRSTTIRTALAAGFAVVFALWLLSGYELVRGLEEVERGVVVSQKTSADIDRTLSAVRTNVLLGSIYLRDALIDNSPVTRQFYRDELKEIRREVERLIPSYLAATRSPLAHAHGQQLQVALQRYWASLDLIVDRNIPATPIEGLAIVRGAVVPAREQVLLIVDSLSAVQQLAHQQNDVEVSLLYGEVRTRVLAIAALAILAGLIVALLASAHVARLHRKIEAQRLSELENRRDLERLSARLVSAQEEERRSLARELHDAVGQALTAIKMDMGVAMRGMEPESRGKAALDDARSIAETTLQSVRDLSQVLHPSMLDDFGLPDTVATYVKGFSRRTGIRVQLTTEGMDDRLSSEHELCLFRIVQEATTNVARHSGARSCRIAMIRRDDAVRVTIDDDGRGMRAGASGRELGRGLGLIGMRERAQALSGTLEIESRPEGGATVRVTLPVARETTVRRAAS